MSDYSIKRIKQIRKKEDSGFGASIPLGTDGLLVDMLSGLDLEEELKLGNDHDATIVQKKVDNVDVTEIEEKYYDEKREIKFSVFISIEEDSNGTTVNMKLFKGAIVRQQGEITETNLLHTKTTTISNEVVDSEEGTRTTEIEEEVDKA